jgi:hypothetical protein
MIAENEMRKYEKKKEIVDRELLIETACDLCGKVAKSGNWESSTYEVNETEITVEVRQKDGVSYPDGGGGTLYWVDMCPDCFKNKLIPWLESQGCQADRKDWSW